MENAESLFAVEKLVPAYCQIGIIYIECGDVDMMNWIWALLMLISVACALATGRMAELSDAVLSGASDAVQLVISLLGMMCLWTGLMKIADTGGLTGLLSRAFAPIMRKLFPDYEPDSPAIKAVCMNVTANLLGLGNAATPMGIAAMKEMAKTNHTPGVANNSMVMFVVINTASIQLIPTMLGIQRARYGAASPFDVLPAVWLTSVVALVFGIILAKLLQRRGIAHG